jgi:hypothetical protein
VRIPLLALGLWSVASAAHAQDWDAYETVFTGLPCPDGWASCVIDGQVVSTGMVLDAQGNLQPAGMRFGFLSFEALPGQNPFQNLSEYTGELGDAREEVAPPVVDATPDPPQWRDRPDRYDPPPYDPPPYEPPPPVDPPPYEPPPPVDPPPYEPPPPVDPPPYEPPPVEPPPIEPPPVEEATPTYVEEATPTYVEEATPTYVEEATPTYVEEATPTYVEETPIEEPLVDASCDDLISIESFAVVGQLGVERRKCLETRLSGESQLTGQSKISRVLINDAKSRGDEADWERLMRRHLQEIDRSDPDMCLMYSIHLSRGGVGRANEVIRWAGYSLENKAQWAGGAHTRNVYNLHKLRAQAAHRLWKSAETRFVDERNDANEAQAARFRAMAKTYAREWLDYAKAAGKDTSQPMSMCVSAAGSMEYCPG